MSSEKKTDTPIRKKKSASTRGASVEAWTGKSGRPHTARCAPGDGARARHAAQADQVHHHRPVLPDGGIVVEAEEQHLIDERADAVRRRLHQPEPEIARRVLHP